VRWTSTPPSRSRVSDEGILLCRTPRLQRSEIELENFDEHMLESGPGPDGRSYGFEISMLTHDIRRLVLKLVDPPEFAWITGQYVEITIPGTDETCSYSFPM